MIPNPACVDIPPGTTELKGRHGWMHHPTSITGVYNAPRSPYTTAQAVARLSGWAKTSGWNSPWQLETTSAQVLRDLSRLCLQLADALEAPQKETAYE